MWKLLPSHTRTFFFVVSHAPVSGSVHASPSRATVRSQRTPPPGAVSQPRSPWHVRVAASLPPWQASCVFCAPSHTMESARQASPTSPVGVHFGLLLASSVQPPRQLHSTANLPSRQRSSALPSTLHARAPSWPQPSPTSAFVLSQSSVLSSLQPPAPLHVSSTYFLFTQTRCDALSLQLPGVSVQSSPGLPLQAANTRAKHSAASVSER